MEEKAIILLFGGALIILWLTEKKIKETSPYLQLANQYV